MNKLYYGGLHSKKNGGRPGAKSKMLAGGRVRNKLELERLFAGVSLSVGKTGRLCVTFHENESAAGAHPAKFTKDCVAFSVEDSLNIVLSLAEPHFDTLARFFIDDIQALQAHHADLNKQHFAELDGLRRELESTNYLLGTISAIVSASNRSKGGPK